MNSINVKYLVIKESKVFSFKNVCTETCLFVHSCVKRTEGHIAGHIAGRISLNPYVDLSMYIEIQSLLKSTEYYILF